MVPVFVVLTILVFVAIDAMRERNRKPHTQSKREPRAIDVTISPGLFLHPSHTWMAINPDGEASVGPDGFLTSAVGDAQTILCREPDEPVTVGDPVAHISKGDRLVPVLSPLTGIVKRLNPGKSGDPVNWVCTIEPTRLGHEIRDLMIAETAGQWLESEARRLAAWLTGKASPVPALPDGGYPLAGSVGSLDDESFSGFVDAFVSRPSDVSREGRR